MTTNALELFMYQVGQLFLWPVLAAITLIFGYAFVALGATLMQAMQRRGGGGRPVIAFADRHPDASLQQLEIHAVRRLEPARLATRVAPMLGLVGTMIPMGPALRALGEGNLASVSQSLTLAFSAVILALIAASITYALLSLQRRWSAEELEAIRLAREALMPVNGPRELLGTDQAGLEGATA